MINAIFKFIFTILNFIFTAIIRLILAVFPAIGLNGIFSVIASFFALLQGAFNFTVFMLGDTAYIFATIISVLFTLKHLALPIVNFVRKFFVH